MNQKKESLRNIQTGLKLTVAGAFALSLLAACGGGSSSGSPTASAPTPSSIGGTVAVGNALAGANVTLIDATGKSTTTTSDVSGSYSIPLAGLTAPFLLVATDPSGVSAPMYSVTASVPTGSSAPAVANITPLTTAVAAELTSDGNPMDLTNPSTLTTQVTPANVSGAVSTLNGILAPVLAANNVTGAFDPISTPFTPNQTGPDAVIDSVVVAPSASGGLQLSSVSDPTTTVSLNSATTSTTTLAAPPSDIAPDYLATLLSQLSSCFAGTTTACSSAIDANYLENGYSSANENSATAAFEAFHPGISATGATITGAKTLAYWPAGQSPLLPNITNPSALVRLYFTSASGQNNFAVTVVQQTQAATPTSPAVWDVIGNQEAYDVTITSFLAQRQFLDTADANGNRYESGLNISIATHANWVNQPNVNAVNVTGPGLPDGGVWLEQRSGTGNNTLALSSAAVTAAPTSPVVSSSNTSLYRWSWQAMPGVTTFTFAPKANNNGYYPMTPLTAQTLPAANSVYTATGYDVNGAVVGSATIINSTTPMLSNAAAGVPWQTFGSDVLANFTNPSGSLADAQASVNVDWSGLVNGQNIAPLVSGVQIQAGSDTSSPTPAEVDGWWKTSAPTVQAGGQYSATVTAGVDQSGAQTCSPACTFPALTTGVSRLLQLNWNADGVNYYNFAKYND
ncbi:carboxypeptidase regulatory-like domain-containing protein [Paraburkholderia dinghuensis]|uniref:Carboxypeptidase regulatory-like domain-containing protein n=1 Tax=Paraburkholderia dinghuensis TaxID=2305225 RepID=A0A3N6NW89_9BURK|nr:carboxypeptidase regulatory-like domain-containing protein [Paraburkholderia dinghuensis]RQH04893.1 carboxypeptidase regulatory-like domain-containing protein [Paraburkholderia dinghuensis]